MKKMEDKELENLINSVMKHNELEYAPRDFASNILSKIQATETKTIFTYEPLISKPKAYTIFTFIIVLFSIVIMNSKNKEFIGIDYLNIAYFNFSNFYPKLYFSIVTLYSVLIATVMLIIQITILKAKLKPNL